MLTFNARRYKSVKYFKLGVRYIQKINGTSRYLVKINSYALVQLPRSA